jgi:hypothetical protein
MTVAADGHRTARGCAGRFRDGQRPQDGQAAISLAVKASSTGVHPAERILEDSIHHCSAQVSGGHVCLSVSSGALPFGL